MYSYEDRIRAVEIFIKLGMRVRLDPVLLNHEQN